MAYPCESEEYILNPPTPAPVKPTVSTNVRVTQVQRQGLRLQHRGSENNSWRPPANVQKQQRGLRGTDRGGSKNYGTIPERPPPRMQPAGVQPWRIQQRGGGRENYGAIQRRLDRPRLGEWERIESSLDIATVSLLL